MKKEFYVYALIDPKDNQIFYIGKEKGKRFLDHSKRNDITNRLKTNRINEIKNNNLEVISEILFSNLYEDNALELEKIIIYKLGREILFEGTLTNIIPGGNWKPGDSLFYEEGFDEYFDLDKLNFLEKERFLSFEKTSQFNYLNTEDSKQFIHTYDVFGNFRCYKTIERI